MKTLHALALASLPLLAFAVAPGFAQVQKAPIGHRQVPVMNATALFYEGHSVDGDLQVALDAALQQAQGHLSEEMSDVRFEWQLERVHGTRGGITGAQDVWVEISVP